MSRGVGPSGDGAVWFDGYQFQGAAARKDPRHAHAAIHPKFRSGAADLRRSLQGGFGWTSALDATPMGGLGARSGKAQERAGGAGGEGKQKKGKKRGKGMGLAPGAGRGLDADASAGAGARGGAGEQIAGAPNPDDNK